MWEEEAKEKRQVKRNLWKFCFVSQDVSFVNKHKYQSKYLATESTRKPHLMHSNVQTEARFFSQTHEIHKRSLYEITAVYDC